MIYTITPNPALDLGGAVRRFYQNEKTYVYDETRFPGGNGVNAARIITRLDVPVLATGFLGGGVGDEFEKLLDQEDVRHRFVRIRGDTRISVTILSKKSSQQTRLSFPGPIISKQDRAHLISLVLKIKSPGLLVIGGSFPPGIRPDFIRALVRTAASKGIHCIIDVPGHLLKDVISAKPMFIKPNLAEFHELVGNRVRTCQAVIKSARVLTKLAPLICVSSVEGGALLVTASHAWFGRIPEVKIKTTVGAGDSMVGAIVAELWKRKLLTREALKSVNLEAGASLLRHGLAAACATLTTHGTRLGTASSIRHYFPLISVISY